MSLASTRTWAVPLIAVLLPACGGGGVETGGPPDHRVEIDATSYAYEPAQMSVSPGTVRFVVHNASDIVHGFEVEGHDLEEEIAEIAPGGIDSLTVRLEEPGAYEIYCPVDDHEQRGMTGTLIVEAGGS